MVMTESAVVADSVTFSRRGNNPSSFWFCQGTGMETIVHPKRSAKDIEQMAARETAAFLRRASITYLECCVSLMLTHLQREEVAAILEKEADMLRRLD
ncbi:hypothetical protein NKI19_08995 [Mesorhizobium sp. M0751]|uniref:hypothetical protein n=1 Tax=unclassified Mesorhizobium TaxID=325217 RepID=UPI00333D4B63